MSDYRGICGYRNNSRGPSFMAMMEAIASDIGNRKIVLPSDFEEYALRSGNTKIVFLELLPANRVRVLQKATSLKVAFSNKVTRPVITPYLEILKNAMREQYPDVASLHGEDRRGMVTKIIPQMYDLFLNHVSRDADDLSVIDAFIALCQHACRVGTRAAERTPLIVVVLDNGEDVAQTSLVRIDVAILNEKHVNDDLGCAILVVDNAEECESRLINILGDGLQLRDRLSSESEAVDPVMGMDMTIVEGAMVPAEQDDCDVEIVRPIRHYQDDGHPKGGEENIFATLTEKPRLNTDLLDGVSDTFLDKMFPHLNIQNVLSELRKLAETNPSIRDYLSRRLGLK